MKRARILVLLGLASAGCAGLIGVPDLTFDETAGDAGPGQTSDGSPDGAVGAVDAGNDAFSAECNTNLEQDPNNCGRCGHACGGGTCTASMCDPITLSDGLDDPTSIALDANYVYYVTQDGVAARVKKDHTGTSESLLTGLENPVGVHVLNNQLFVGSDDGVTRCDLDADGGAGCLASKKTINTTYETRNITSADGILYWVDQSDIHRMLPDGGGEYTLTSSTQPWDVVSDGQHVYYTNGTSTLARVQIDGGNPEDIGPENGKYNEQFVAQNGDSFFWSVVDYDTDAGHVYAGTKASPTNRIAFPQTGSPGQALGIAADTLYVYWSDAGNLAADDVNSESDGSGRLLACPRGGCATTGPLVLATGLKGAGQIQLDADSIYFLENNNFKQGGRLRKVAKP